MQSLARTPKQIGSTLRRHRRSRQLSQSALAGRAGLRQATISSVETGDAGTSLKTLCDMLAALNLELVIQPRTQGFASDIEAML